MSTLLQLRTDLDNRISAAKVSGFWTDAMKNEWLNQAGQRVCDFKRWKWLELAIETPTTADEYYDYPTGEFAFKQNSIFLIYIDGESYPTNQTGRSRKTWAEYQKHKQSESDEKIFANHNGYYFLAPLPEVGKTMSIYGLKKWVELTEDADSAVTPEEYDEAVVRIALATCLRKAKKYGEAKVELVEVLDPNIGILALLWAQENDEAAQGYGGNAQSSRWD